MKVLKYLLIIIAAVIAIILIIPAFLPSTLNVERSIVIDTPPQTPYHLVNSMDKWPKWNEWSRLDTAQKITFDGPAAGEGASYSWVSENPDVGTGTMTILKSIPAKQIDLELSFYEEEFGLHTVTFEETEGKTKVTMSIDGELDYFSRYAAIPMEDRIGQMLDKSLARLKEMAEAMPRLNYSIDVVQVERTPVIAIKDSTEDMSQENMSQKFGAIYGELGGFMQKNNIQPAGAPLAVTHFYNDKKYVFSGGFPLKTFEGIQPGGRIYFSELPAGKAVKAIYTGPYDNLENVYGKIHGFIHENEYEIAGDSWEVYLNSPQEVKPDALITHIFYPVK